MIVVCVAAVSLAVASPAGAEGTTGLIRVIHHITRLGSVPVGTSVPRTFTVRNLSGAPIDLTTFEVFGDNGNWQLQLSPGCHAGTVLPSGGSCSYVIVTTPVKPGKIRGTFCVTGVVSATLWERRCGRIRGYAPKPL
jgi:hypothetical protein